MWLSRRHISFAFNIYGTNQMVVKTRNVTIRAVQQKTFFRTSKIVMKTSTHTTIRAAQQQKSSSAAGISEQWFISISRVPRNVWYPLASRVSMMGNENLCIRPLPQFTQYVVVPELYLECPIISGKHYHTLLRKTIRTA